MQGRKTAKGSKNRIEHRSHHHHLCLLLVGCFIITRMKERNAAPFGIWRKKSANSALVAWFLHTAGSFNCPAPQHIANPALTTFLLRVAVSANCPALHHTDRPCASLLVRPSSDAFVPPGFSFWGGSRRENHPHGGSSTTGGKHTPSTPCGNGSKARRLAARMILG